MKRMIASVSMIAMGMIFQPSVHAIEEADQCRVELKVIEVSPPVIERGDPGSDESSNGFEGGTVIKHKGLYHLFTAVVPGIRLEHWTSPDRVKWTRESTIREAVKDVPGMSNRARIWAPMPFYVESEKRWYLYYIAYRSKPTPKGDEGWYGDYDGKSVLAVSETPGPDGLYGPWKDLGIAMESEFMPWSKNPSQLWEGQQGPDSISPPYQAANGKWMVFYGGAQTQVKPKNYSGPYPYWAVGLAESDTPKGPWKRRIEGNPIDFGNFTENPLVIRLKSGTYVMIADGGPIYATSLDGIKWSKGKRLYFGGGAWFKTVRTPLGLIPEEDGTYTMFFMGAPKNVARKWQNLAYCRVEIEEIDE